MASKRVKKNKQRGMNKKHGKKPMSQEQKAENKKSREIQRERTFISLKNK